jgi:dsDNA-specific endonuclease/ATPase MutS2
MTNIQVGDDQNAPQGESTYMMRLKFLSRTVNKISTNESSSISEHSLVLLDEFGNCTDPEEAICIAQAMLETILNINPSKTISTTHSSQLKELSLSDDIFTAVSVLLQGGNSNKYKVQTYESQQLVIWKRMEKREDVPVQLFRHVEPI